MQVEHGIAHKRTHVQCTVQDAVCRTIYSIIATCIECESDLHKDDHDHDDDTMSLYTSGHPAQPRS